MNRDGKLYTLIYGRPCSLQLDPIEKEPVYHVLPGTRIFCTATAGCNYRCLFCHNWQISQKRVEDVTNYSVAPEGIAMLAQRSKCEGVSFTYSEPTIYYEYMFDVAQAAKKRGLRVVCHTNGGMSRQPMLDLLKYLDAVTVDLKAFSDAFYHGISMGELDVVLDTLKTIHRAGVHLEIVNLVVPKRNDAEAEFRQMTKWIVENLGPDVPVHFNRFGPAYRMRNVQRTPIAALERAREIGIAAGIKYIYIGNVPGHKHNSTYCAKCGKRLIARVHFSVLENHVKDGKCPQCNETIPGVWA